MLGSFYWGVSLVAMSPIDFLRKPARWLRALSDHHGTVSAGPNFAYSLAARKVRDAAGETLAELLQGAPDPLAAVERWRLRARSSRAQETLAAACMRLPVFAAP